jgi:SAM-dependent methyltransferase
MDAVPGLPHVQRKCPVCGHTAREVLHQQRFAELSAEGLLAGYDVVHCCECGMCFGDCVPEQKAFDRYYEVMSKYEVPRRPAAATDANLHRFLEIIPYIERAARPQDSILEVGCASGQLLHLLEQRGYCKLRGIDPSPACAQMARDYYGIPAECGTFASLQPARAAADCVILIGVLEHMRDLDQATAALHELIPNGGRVFISVPDASRYVNGVDAPFQEFSVEHVNFFGPRSLTNLMRAHGFEPLFCEPASVLANTNTITPVIHGAFVRAPSRARSESGPFARDEVTHGALREYIAKSRREHDYVIPVLERLAQSDQPVVVWGAGTHTLRLLAEAPLKHAKLACVIDSNPRYQGKRIGNIPVRGPDCPPQENASILISSRVYQDEICHQIRAILKWQHPLITLY